MIDNLRKEHLQRMIDLGVPKDEIEGNLRSTAQMVEAVKDLTLYQRCKFAYALCFKSKALLEELTNLIICLRNFKPNESSNDEKMDYVG